VNSRLYIGKVAHTRHVPKVNSFRYGIYYLLADIDELDQLDARYRWFGHNRASLVSFHDDDHGPLGTTSLREWMEGILDRAGIDISGGSIRVLTFPRVLGAKFYPVSFWYCYHSDGTVRAILAEVQNTFRDHHNYLLHNQGDPIDFSFKPRVTKVFHVSPFIKMDAFYEFRFTEPGEKLSVTINDYVEGPLLLTAAIALHAEEITDRALLGTVLRHGPISLVAWLRIHWQAVRIVSKGIGYIPRTEPPTEATSIWTQQEHSALL
jgi:DUF1365 family protein